MIDDKIHKEPRSEKTKGKYRVHKQMDENELKRALEYASNEGIPPSEIMHPDAKPFLTEEKKAELRDKIKEFARWYFGNIYIPVEMHNPISRLIWKYQVNKAIKKHPDGIQSGYIGGQIERLTDQLYKAIVGPSKDPKHMP